MFNLQKFALPGTITTADINAHTLEVEFVSSFGTDLEAFTQATGISRPIRKANGTHLTAYKVSGQLESGQVAEGEVIPFSNYKVSPVDLGPIGVDKYALAVTIEAVAKYGKDKAYDRTADEFAGDLMGIVEDKMYNAMLAGGTKLTATGFQAGIAKAIGNVKNLFKKMHKSTPNGIAVFVNTMDLYDYLGTADITVQTSFGMDYIQNFMGASLVFISSEIPQGRIIATPVNNLLIYYVDPADSEFAQIGLPYTADPENPYVGFHIDGNYSRAQSELYAIMGLEVQPEYVDGVAVVTLNSSPTLTAITVTPSAGTEDGTTKATVSGNTSNNLKYALSDEEGMELNYGMGVRNWKPFTASTDIPATDGQYLNVVEYDEYYKVIGGGSVAVVLNSGD